MKKWLLVGVVLALAIAVGTVFVVLRMQKDDPMANTVAPSTRNFTIHYGRSIEVARTTVPSRGGSLDVRSPGSPLDGLVLTVAADSCESACEFSISHAPITKCDEANGFKPISPMITIEASKAISGTPVALRIPARIPPGHVAMAFYYDPERRTLEAIPTVAEDSDSVSIVTRHFSQVVVGATPETELEGRIPSSFEPGKDDWSFPNKGTVVSPRGICSGMSISAMWYFVEKASRGSPRLSATYNNGTPSLWQDDVLGLKLASVVQKDAKFDNVIGKVWSGFKNLVRSDRWVYNQIAQAIKVTGQPQLITVGSHMMIAYGVDDGKLLIADPNHPGQRREMRYTDGKFEGYVVDGKKQTSVSFVGQSALVKWDTLEKRWSQLETGAIGKDEFPNFSLVAVGAYGRRIPLTFRASVPVGKITVEAVTTRGRRTICDIFPEDLGDVGMDGYAKPKGPWAEVDRGRRTLRVAVYDIGKDHEWEWMGFKEVTVAGKPATPKRASSRAKWAKDLWDAAKNQEGMDPRDLQP